MSMSLVLLAKWLAGKALGLHEEDSVDDDDDDWVVVPHDQEGSGLAAAPVSRDAVFTLSHVHCPASSTSTFTAGARWLLPRCRQREAKNGQRFEHLHARATSSASGTCSDGRSYRYRAANAGFEAQNVGRGSRIPEGTAANEFVWFEQWRDWSGVEKHGSTGWCIV